MTDLTEKLKKGELKQGVYYVLYYKNDTAEVDIYRRVYSLHNESEVRFTIPQVTKVLAPVPSYEQWQAKLNENAKLKTEYEKECHRADELEDSYWKAEKENSKLKKQVAIAVKALDSLRGICYPQVAEKAFEQIKELDK